MKLETLFISSALAAFTLAAADKDGFKPLFNGKNLDGWEQHSGKAEYRVEDGCIVGKTVAGTGNSFLCSKKKYGDFIFEFEFKVGDMNSGVQFRSEIAEKESTTEVKGKTKKVEADRVFGYQYEIDPSDRAFTAGVYDEARRRVFLAGLETNEAARKAFKKDEWNKGRIECQGDHIQTWINGVQAADFHDALTPKGIFGLQVHGIGDGKKKPAGEEVRWRNIRIKEL
ncbi:MAG TPA: DUF1080 domain-containing protein [Verrucomicrobiae bacterium]|jgi:hypothetical protein